MKNKLNSLRIIFPSLVAVVIVFIGIFRTFYSYEHFKSESNIKYVFIFFSFPMFLLASGMFLCSIKDKVSSGYLVSSGILLGVSIRHFSEIFIAHFENYSIYDFSTFLLLGFVFFFLSFFLFIIGWKKNTNGHNRVVH